MLFSALLCILLSSKVTVSQSHKAKHNPNYTTITNFNKKGEQLIRFSRVGDAIDAHDGEIALFNGVYYLYGTSYDCGFSWGNKQAPFCGFKVYSSTDLVNWADRGLLFDATTPVWQSRCNGSTYGCFRPHVIFNKITNLYVLWINVYDNVSGYRVFTGKSPAGPFTEVAEPRLAVNSDAPAAGLNNGDHDTFVDDDGTGYLAYTDWRTKGSIVIEKLDDTYTTGTGVCIKTVTTGSTEAPALFKRNGIYYVVYSDPNCGYCSGTGASYRTASSPLGPWSEGKKISDNSCGGQPSFVSTIKLAGGSIFLFGSDLWNNAAKNEALANYYWAPLSFNADGSIKPMECLQAVKVRALNAVETLTLQPGYKTYRDIDKTTQRFQSFKASKTGLLTTLSLTAFKLNTPDSGLTIQVFKADGTSRPKGSPLKSLTITSASVSWSAKNILMHPDLKLVKGTIYCIVVKSTANEGNYGLVYRYSVNSKSGYSTNAGQTFSSVNNQSLKYQVLIR
ncbi:Glycosyl hydrolases family 43 [Mucilaginibacter xinganensis]|uniref:Glycosyl hydrolases family 43 n=2 Tax=Mucilaginibacter xinganensis TaxID=1234841 RepID=A0A223P2I5_9SPHI|nr:Glycosyl hydrolases family 43 [Mucilaginibacter xinganensis]